MGARNDLRRIKATILIAQKRLNVSAVNSENFVLQNALPLLKMSKSEYRTRRFVYVPSCTYIYI